MWKLALSRVPPLAARLWPASGDDSREYFAGRRANWRGLSIRRLASVSLLTCLSLVPAPLKHAAVYDRGKLAAEQTFPATGSATLRYRLLTWDILPQSAYQYAGRRAASIHFSIRDRLHFLVQIEITAPAIDVGTLTVAMDGTRLSSFDSRTGEAAVAHLSPQSIDVVQNTLLPFLVEGGPEGGLPPQPSSGQGLQSYLSCVARYYALAAGHRPDCPWTRSRLAAYTMLSGHPADLIDLRPLLREEWVTGCSFSHPGHCSPHTRDFGAAQIWIDREHPFVLGYQEKGAGDGRHSRSSLSYRVASVTYGQGPTNADLDYRPPGMPIGGVDPEVVGVQQEAGVLGRVVVPAGFVRPVRPKLALGKEKFSPVGAQWELNGASMAVPAVRVLYSTGDYVPNYDFLHRHWGRRVRARYVYIEQRRQLQGLPISLTSAHKQAVGECAGWSGRFPTRDRWIAFSASQNALEIVSDVLTARQMAAYAVQSRLCPSQQPASSGTEQTASQGRQVGRHAGAARASGWFAASHTGIRVVARSPAASAGCRYRARGRIIRESGSEVVTYQTLNTGRAMPHLVVVFKADGTWSPRRLLATMDRGHGARPAVARSLRLQGAYGWDLGSLPSGALSSAELTVKPAGACCPAPALHAYADVDPKGNPDESACLTGCNFAANSRKLQPGTEAWARVSRS